MTQVPRTNTFGYMNRDLDNKVGIPSPSQVVIIDIEASSLRGVSGDTYDTALLSYPVEIAVALDNGDSQAYLIRPEPGWQDWNSEPSDEDIGAIHRISRTRLFEEGRNSRFVAECHGNYGRGTNSRPGKLSAGFEPASRLPLRIRLA